MADENPTGQSPAKCLTTDEEDRREQAAVLRRVLEIHPQTLTQDELIRDLTSGSKEFREVDAAQRALRELAAAGLLHRPGADGTIRPTRAALRYFELSARAA